MIGTLLGACAPAAETIPTPIPVASIEATATPAIADQPAPDMLARGLKHRSYGEYDLAADDFHALADSYPNAVEARPARFYLAESFALRGRWGSAADALRAFLADGAQDEWAGRALFWLARCHEEAGSWAEAVRVYEQYRALDTPLADYATLRMAAQQRSLNNPNAAELFAAVAASGIARGERAGSHEKAIALFREQNNPARALELYTSLLGFIESDAYRARILGEAATLAREQAANDQARIWERELVAEYADSAEAGGAVVTLLADPAGELLPADAARVYEARGQFSAALPLLEQAIATAGGEAVLDARRRRGLAMREIGDLAGAQVELDAVAAETGSEAGRQAALDAIQTRGQAGDTQAAIESYRAFANQFPDDPRAAEALDRAAQLAERTGDIEGAMQQRLDLGRRYPTSPPAQTALDLAAWHFYRAARPAEARGAWELLANAHTGAVAARAAFWAGRAAGEAGDQTAQQALSERAVLLAPDSYYGVRAAELLGTLPEADVPLAVVTSADEWDAADAWLAGWSAPVTSTIAIERPITRAIELGYVGLANDAIAEWNEARALAAGDGAALLAIARRAAEADMPYIAIKAAEDVVALAPADALPVPVAVRRLQFPTPYPELVTERAREYNLDPRAVYALLRQESLFNPQATSWVGARGLAQVMPETAAGIAIGLGIENLTPEDLYKPTVSVRFGAHYIGNQLVAMNGSLQGALAAYNGGPGNAVRWADGDTVADPELFVETIDYPETEHYVKLVYGYYGAYRGLYGQ